MQGVLFMTTTIRTIFASFVIFVLLAAPVSARAQRTHISIADSKWRLNGRITYPGMPYDRFTIEHLFKPLGIEEWWFEYFSGDQKHGRHPSHSLALSARDMFRIAYCMLRNGNWLGEQVIPEWFVDETAAPTHNIKGTKTFGREAQSFSHGWELPARLTDGRGEGIPIDARFKPGAGGQLIAFVPSLDLVLARKKGSGWPELEYEKFLRLACEAVLD
jgi:hypothetical protein